MKILVTGSRTWKDERAVWAALDNEAAPALLNGQEVTVFHGAAEGADTFADNWAHHHMALRRNGISDYQVVPKAYPIDRRSPRGTAGIFRNIAMMANRPDVVLAFINADARGTLHCAGLADDRGIRVERFYE